MWFLNLALQDRSRFNCTHAHTLTNIQYPDEIPFFHVLRCINTGTAWIRKKTADGLILLLCIKMHRGLILFLAPKDQQLLFFMWFLRPGFCGYIFQSPACLAFCADSSCEEYFSTSLAAPLACFPSSFFGWGVCFFFVSVNIISSLPRPVETVAKWGDLNFRQTEHGRVCFCVALCGISQLLNL